MPSTALIAAVSAFSAASALTATAAYAGLSSSSQMFGPSLVAPPLPSQLALTFDDGPNPSATPALLDLLAKYGVRATFFLIGAHARREPALTREIAAAGHIIGNHTMHHPWLPRHSNARIREELTACSAVLEDVLGRPVALFRPPHGARRPAVLQIASELGLITVQWNLIVGDWKPIAAEEIHRRLTSGIDSNRLRGRGTMAVLHDGSQHTPAADRTRTVEAVRLLLKGRDAGELTFVTPPAWV